MFIPHSSTGQNFAVVYNLIQAEEALSHLAAAEPKLYFSACFLMCGYQQMIRRAPKLMWHNFLSFSLSARGLGARRLLGDALAHPPGALGIMNVPWRRKECALAHPPTRSCSRVYSCRARRDLFSFSAFPAST